MHCIVALALSGAACTPTGIAQDFARFSRCPEKEVQITNADYDSAFPGASYKASGCGVSAEYVCNGTISCESPQVIIMKRHASMYGCNIANVHAEKIAGAAWKTTGCNQQAIFNCFASHDVPVRCITDTEANASHANRQ